MKSVIVTIVDKQHLPYLDRFFSLARQNGQWQDDFAILAYNMEENDVDLKRFREQGVYIYYSKPIVTTTYRHWTPVALTYFYLFTPYFRRWDRIVYLDVDCMVRTSLKNLINQSGFYASNFYHRGHPDFMINGFKLTADDLINDGVMVFTSDVIKKNTFFELLKIYQTIDLQQLPKVYGGGIDELVLAIYFQGQKKNLPLEYNVIPNELRQQFGIGSGSVYGSIIHHASGIFYSKPWETTSPFYAEWLKERARRYRLSEKIKLWLVLLGSLTFDQGLGLVGLWLRHRLPVIYFKLKKLGS